MKTVIRRHKIREIWHFTDALNLDSIRKHGGLLSLKELEERGIEIPAPGGNDWSHDADRQKGVDKYVHLTFSKSHPMLFRAKQDERIINPFWLEIDSTILLDSSVRFTSDVSNKSGVEILGHDEALRQIDFEVLFTFMDWNDEEVQQRRQTAEKAEILVPTIVPLDKIQNIG